MDLRLLQTFHAVTQCGTLNAAAVKLGYAQSTVTQHIQQLEGQLGVALFHRNGKRMKISEAGKLLQERAETLLRHADEIQRFLGRFAAGNGGALRIGAVEPFASTHVPALLCALLREPHSINVEVEVAAAQTLYSELFDGKLDLAIGPQPLGYSGLHFEPLFFEPMAFLVPRSHRLARKSKILLPELLNEPLILSGKPCAFRRAFEGVTPAPSDPSMCITITSVDARKAAAQAGLGIAVVPLSSARPAPAGTILRTPLGKTVGVTIGLSRRGDAYFSPATARFAKLVSDRLGGRGLRKTA